MTDYTVGVDMIPNVTGYPSDCLFDTPFTKPDGSFVQFYSNNCEGVVDLHFKTMSDYGISGAFLQRFYGYINEANGNWIEVCLNLAMHLILRVLTTGRFSPTPEAPPRSTAEVSS
jgi:hypothetical protein